MWVGPSAMVKSAVRIRNGMLPRPTRYTKLEQEIIPLFYYRDAHGLPIAWIERVREHGAPDAAVLRRPHSARVPEKYYLPAASAYGARAKEDGASAARILSWRQAVAELGVQRALDLQRFRPTMDITFSITNASGDLSPEFVQSNSTRALCLVGSPERHVMTRESGPEQASTNECFYSGVCQQHAQQSTIRQAHSTQ